MFEEKQTARADLTAGTLYAITGNDGWIYYGQVTPEKCVGFFQRRDRQLAEATDALAAPVMSVITVLSIHHARLERREMEEARTVSRRE